MHNAVKRVAIKTPLALKSLRIRKNKKKAPKFSMAPSANKLPICPCSTAASKVAFILKSENSKTYKSVPIVFAIRPTINPIIISFFEFILNFKIQLFNYKPTHHFFVFRKKYFLNS